MLGMGGSRSPQPSTVTAHSKSIPRVGEPGWNLWANASLGNLSLAAMHRCELLQHGMYIRMSHTGTEACLSGTGNPSTAQTSGTCSMECGSGTSAPKQYVNIDLESSKKRNIHATSIQHSYTQSKVRWWIWCIFLYNPVPLSSLYLGSSFQPVEDFGLLFSFDLRFERAMSFFAFSGASKDAMVWRLGKWWEASPESSTHLRSTGLPCTERS